MKKGSGAEHMFSLIMEEYGILGKLKKNYLNWSAGVDALVDGIIKACPGNFPGGKPNPGMLNLASRKPYRALELDLDVMKRVNAKNKGILTVTLPKEAYEGFKADVIAPGIAGCALSTAAVDDDVVYEFCKAVFENTDELYSISKVSDSTKLENAMKWLMPAYPVHPGAARYFKKKVSGTIDSPSAPANFRDRPVLRWRRADPIFPVDGFHLKIHPDRLTELELEFYEHDNRATDCFPNRVRSRFRSRPEPDQRLDLCRVGAVACLCSLASAILPGRTQNSTPRLRGNHSGPAGGDQPEGRPVLEMVMDCFRPLHDRSDGLFFPGLLGDGGKSRQPFLDRYRPGDPAGDSGVGNYVEILGSGHSHSGGWNHSVLPCTGTISGASFFIWGSISPVLSVTAARISWEPSAT